ncbi:hypothetical protein K1T73_10395 [Roseovarius sp. SCSIO 43702]|uniref:hypothetical protein n=1 Tax=Roseovarius sp. SCSIO 43702 TaxID=2823043 RepID=UPI001C73685B|nr:hypothetical protein [Roseovarius sp. SCSIO 43702]QYX55511.1 hypothetical protein K1T73_10395 [Roseovarius sp. SCSIO 43702]
MTWEKQIVRRTLEGAGEYPGVQLQFLLQRLEHTPEAVTAIADAIRDMGEWYQQHADELDAEARRRNGGAEVMSIARQGEGTA